MILPDGYHHHPPPPEDDRGSNVAHLPAALAHRQPHVLGAAVTIPPEQSDTGFEQKEKVCRNCGAVRVTILGSALGGRVCRVRRAWRSEAGAPLIETAVEPPCPQLSKAVP